MFSLSFSLSLGGGGGGGRQQAFFISSITVVGVQLKATNSIVLILTSKEDEDEWPAASLPYAALPIVLGEEYFPADSSVREVLSLFERHVSV